MKRATMRREIAKRRSRQLLKLLERCPYQTLIGPSRVLPPNLTPELALETMGSKLGVILILIEGPPESLSARTMADVQEVLSKGQLT